MKVFFRVDYNIIIGSGHILRCKLLIEKILAVRENVKIYIICRSNKIEKKVVKEIFNGLNIKFYFLKVKKNILKNNYSTWLRSDHINDSKETSKICVSNNINKNDILIIDHYGVKREWIKNISPNIRTLVIDDFIRTNLQSDFILNGNLKAKPNFYKKSNKTKVFCSPKFAIFKPNYKPSYFTNFKNKNILIFFSNSDIKNFGYKILNSLIKNYKNLPITLIQGSNSNNLNKKIFNKYKNVKIFKFVNNFDKIIKKATLCIGGCGSTYISRVFYNIPTIVFQLSKNQEPFCKYLTKNNMSLFLGSEENYKEKNFIQKFNKIWNNKEDLKKYSNNCKGYFDKYSISRIVEIIKPSGTNKVKLKNLSKNHLEILYDWANDKEVIKNSLNRKKLKFIQHKKWFNKIYNSKKVKLFILYVRDLPVGQIRFDILKNKILIDYSLDEFIRGKGYGKVIVKLGLKKILKIKKKKIIAVVKKTNISSKRVFESLNFKLENKNKKYLNYYHV